MICILQGNAILHINDDVYEVETGDTFFVSPYDLHYTEIKKGDTYVSRCVCFDMALLQDTALQQGLEDGTLAFQTVIKNESVFKTVLHVYEACFAHNDGWRLEVQGWLFLLFAALKREGFLKTVSAPREELFCKQVLAFLQENYAGAITSADMAKALFLSQGHFCRQFKANFGDNFSNYLRRYRLEQSRELLFKTTLSVTAVARAVGFDDPCYYTKSFRETFGLTPRAFRKKEKTLSHVS